MTYLLVAILGALAVGAVLVVVGLRRATQGALRAGAPTSDEARIRAQTEAATSAATESSEQQQREVMDATGEALVQRKRDSLSRGLRK